MDDARQIVLQALEQAGVPIPDAVVQSSFDLSPSALVSIASAAVALIRRLPPPPPTLFPQSMADRFRICSDLASAIKDLGYGADISFHHFLYPSEEETHKILRFLLDRISSSNDGIDFRNDAGNRLAGDSLDASMSPEDRFGTASVKGGNSAEHNESEEYKTTSIILSRTEEELKDLELGKLEEILSKLSQENTKLAKDVVDLEQHLTQLEMDWEPSAKQLELLKRDSSLLEEAARIALDSSKADADKLKELTDSIHDGKLQVDTLNSKENTVQDRERQNNSLEVSASNGGEQLEVKLKETREEIDHVIAMSKLREEQLASLTVKLEHATQGLSRSFYVKRITELIKNSKKLDIDISRIIGEIRDLQRESNVNQGRLKRIYALVDEVIFRDAKRESLSRQAYRFLTSLHDNLSECYDKVFSIDRLQGEISDMQATIESLEKRPVDLKKLQADIDIIVAENLSLLKI